MDLIYRALLRNKLAVLLIVVQIAVTLAIVANSAFNIRERAKAMSVNSGIDESKIALFGANAMRADFNHAAQFQADLAAIKAIPGVENAYFTNSLPMTNGGWSLDLSRSADDESNLPTALYMGDENMIPTLGLKLIAGRNFLPTEVTWLKANTRPNPPVVILSKALAVAAFGSAEKAIGKRVGLSGDAKLEQEVIGVVETLLAPWPSFDFFQHGSIVPLREEAFGNWVVRSSDDAIATTRLARDALAKLNFERVIGEKVTAFKTIRDGAYEGDLTMIWILGMMSSLLLIMTAMGLVGIVSFWVAQRNKQIGTKRALGATRTDILRGFQLENLLIMGTGVIIGALLAYGINFLMASDGSAQRMPFVYVLLSALGIVVLGQLAVLQPARRACTVSPAIATRTV